MAWVYLTLAGLCEVVYAAMLKPTQGFTKPLPIAIFLISVLASFALLALAARQIPIGTAYAVWSGIGVAGAARSAFFFIMSQPPRFACSSWRRCSARSSA
jgi:quaternary ammonium compound-resistance protein SugE